MLFDNLKIIVEVILILVIIIGILSSRAIARRLSAIREIHKALELMVANLDSSTEHAGRLFEAMQQESARGGKKLSALVEYARNATEDLQDLQKMAAESSADIERELKVADEKKASLLEAIGQASQILEKYDSQMQTAVGNIRKKTETPPAGFEIAPEVQGDVVPSLSAKMNQKQKQPFSAEEMITDLPPEEEVSSATFSDKLEGVVPRSLRNPRPYMTNLDKK